MVGSGGISPLEANFATNFKKVLLLPKMSTFFGMINISDGWAWDGS
jgi:hypothetical protein